MRTIPWSQGLAARISWCRDFPFLGTQSINYKLPQVDCSRVEPIENKMNGIWLEKEHPRGPHLPSPVLSLFLVSSAIFWRCWAPRRDSPRPGPPPCPVRSSPPSVSDICPPPWPACWSGCGPAPAWIWSEEDSSGVSGAQFSALSLPRTASVSPPPSGPAHSPPPPSRTSSPLQYHLPLLCYNN